MTSLNFQLLKWQQEVFKDPHRFKVVAAAIQTTDDIVDVGVTDIDSR
jgi:hypothetical protein